jgi:hypothetical protein
MGEDRKAKNQPDADLEETKRIMERLVRTPPKPRGKKPSTKGGDDAKKEDGGEPPSREG